MVKEQYPKNPVSKSYRPANGKRVKVRTGASWVSLARDHLCPGGNRPPVENLFGRGRALAFYNYQTDIPAEINWYLHHHYGSTYSDDGGDNYAFHTDAKPGMIYLPTYRKPQATGGGLNSFWFGIGVQTSGRFVVGADATYGVMYNTQSTTPGQPPNIRYVDVMDEGYTFSAGLGGSGGLVLLFGYGVSDPRDFEAWGTTWTDFAFSMGPNAKSITKLIPALNKIPELTSFAKLGSKLTHAEATYEKLEPLKTVAEGMHKNGYFTQPGLFMLPYLGANGGLEIGFGGRAHRTSVVDYGKHEPRSDHAERTKKNEEIRRRTETVHRPSF